MGMDQKPAGVSASPATPAESWHFYRYGGSEGASRYLAVVHHV
jgi:hypothetical protein